MRAGALVKRKPRRVKGETRRRRARREAAMPRACARMFVKVAAELDAHAQRLTAVESGLLIVATKAGVPF